MSSIFRKLFDIHTAIGKIMISICIILVFAGVIGLLKGKIFPVEEVVSENYFIGDSIPLHDGNYNLTVNYAKTTNEVTILNKKGDEKTILGNFIVVNITISKDELSELNIYKIATNDFKLKDHTGIYVPLNSIMGAMGWDAINVHIDDKKGGHIMSSTKFPTKNSLKDYHYYNQPILHDEKTFDVIFKMDKGISVENELMVLEVDFYVGSSKHKKGSDIILLPKPSNID